MRMKSIYLATTAVALLTGSGAAQAGDIYVSVLGGTNFQPGNSGAQTTSEASTSFKSDPDTGYVIGGAIGAHLTKWVEGLRAELEVSYRHNKLNGHWHTTTSSFFNSSSGSLDGNLDGKVSNFAIMANVWYDIDVGSKIKPYIGGGVGWDRAKLDVAAIVTTGSGDFRDDPGSAWSSSHQDQSGFAWQLGVGVNYPVTPRIDVCVGYRYFRGPGFDPIFIGKNGLPTPFDNENHSVSANVTFAIN